MRGGQPTDADTALFDLPEGELSPSELVGARIRLARQRKGLKQNQLAVAVGKTPRAAGAWEAGKSGLHAKTLQAVADELDFPVHYFQMAEQLPRISRPNFRVTAETANWELNRFSSYAVLVGQLLRLADRWTDIELRSPSLFPVALNEFGWSAEDAARATRVALSLGDGPIRNVIETIESLGVLVVYGPPEITSIDAFSTWVDGRPLIVLNPEHSALRLRIDAAHELGHLVMHTERERDADNASLKIREGQAKRFARAFLMPPTDGVAARLVKAVRTYHFISLANVEKAWGVELDELLTYTKQLEPKVRDLADDRAKEARLPSWKAELQLVADARPREDVQLVPDLLSRAASEASTSLDDLAWEDGIPDRYVKLISSRVPTEAGQNPHLVKANAAAGD